MLSDYEPFIKSLEPLDDETILSKISSDVWSAQKKQWASDFLNKRSSCKRNAREEETLAIAKDANRIASEALKIAREQARWAMWAAIIATIAIIIAAMAYIKTP